MLKNAKLATKMFLSFGILAVIALSLGLTGFFGLTQNDKSITEIGSTRLPALKHLLGIKLHSNEVRTSLGILLDLELDKAQRKEQYDHILIAREKYLAAWKEYSELPQGKEETEAWQQFILSLEDAKKDNNAYLKIIKKIDALDIGNPMDLYKDLERFRGDHYKLATSLLNMLISGKVFEGGEDHTMCNMGKWMATLETSNPALQQRLQDIYSVHQEFHESVKHLKKNRCQWQFGGGSVRLHHSGLHQYGKDVTKDRWVD
ncbi:MCP four helix bundle domain-containing protein [Desulfobulbus rhabdoformis]|uniref:MCP four helix bundle domain-containing protein n=1 Tax=Desulfobulbus rhabdoformis TaxID=34032 RepID=UPI0019661172|nr:MCP four helix bundle domain-containing protein [Desulfobulbus rhabdoformis]MBM9615611.1 MCP four helix bundle domain-containing protein [Desulfobulbus rhabdoformis]